MWIVEHIQNEAWIPPFAWAFWVIFSITLHELGHGYAAIRQGDRTPIEWQRMTLNPLVHMGVPSLIIFAFFGIAWGMMPVNPSRFRQRRLGEAKVALAGPAVNLGLALVCLVGTAVAIRALGGETSFARNLEVFLLHGAYLNLVLMAFNLLPVPPLDGSRVLAASSRRFRLWFSHPNAQFGLFIILAIVFYATPIGDYFFGACIMGSLLAIEGLTLVMGAGPDAFEDFIERFVSSLG